MHRQEDEFFRRPKSRARHLSVTVLLGLMVVYYTFCGVVNLAALLNRDLQARLAELYPFPGWVIPTVTLCFLLNVVWALALLAWKKWGFYALVFTTLCLYTIPLAAGGMEQLIASWKSGELVTTGELLNTPLLSLIALIALVILLRKGGPRSTWSQLE